MIPNILEQLVPRSSAIDVVALASVAKEVIKVTPQHTTLRIRSRKDVFYAFRGLPAGTRRLIEDINVAYALMRHVPTSELQGLPASLALLLQEGDCSIADAGRDAGHDVEPSPDSAGPSEDDHGEPGSHCADTTSTRSATTDSCDAIHMCPMAAKLCIHLLWQRRSFMVGHRKCRVCKTHMNCLHETVYEQGAALRREIDLRDARIEELRQQVAQQASSQSLDAVVHLVHDLDTKLHECFEEADDDALSSVQRELAAMTAQVALHITEFDGIKKEFKQVYEDTDELEEDVRRDLTPAAGADAETSPQLCEALKALERKVDSNARQLDVFERAFEPSINRIYVRMQQGEESAMQETSKLETRLLGVARAVAS